MFEGQNINLPKSSFEGKSLLIKELYLVKKLIGNYLIMN
jgi:hypothetical protein